MFSHKIHTFVHFTQIILQGEKIENNTMSIQVPPALPVKQRIQQGRRSAEMRTASTYDNVNCDFPDTDTVDSHDIRYKVRKMYLTYYIFCPC